MSDPHIRVIENGVDHSSGICPRWAVSPDVGTYTHALTYTRAIPCDCGLIQAASDERQHAVVDRQRLFLWALKFRDEPEVFEACRKYWCADGLTACVAMRATPTPRATP